jgi:hypothetical protein
MNVFLKKNAENLLEGVQVGDRISVTWFLNSAALGGAQEMGPLPCTVTHLDDRWINLRDISHGALLRLPRTAIRSVRPVD